MVGRPARNIESLWPQDIETANILWPGETDANIEVRILGDAQCYLQKFNKDFYPNNWVSFQAGDISQDAFYASIDYFVYFPDENWPQTLSPEALVAYSSGCVVILPKRFEAVHRSRAVYLGVEEVPRLIREQGPPDRAAKGRRDALNDIQAGIDSSRRAFVEALDVLVHELEEQETKIG